MSTTVRPPATDRDRLATDGTAILIAEDQLVVGKRDLGRSSSKVRSYVTDLPVSEQVTVRSERISVERRAVDQSRRAGTEDAYGRAVELTEIDEEAVVGKSARVIEEVVISKDVGSRTETVTDAAVARILAMAAEMTGSLERASIWFKHQPIPGYAGATARDLVAGGEAQAVLTYLEATRAGVYA